MNKLVVVVVVLIMVFAGLIAYHIYTEPKYPSYHVDMYLNASNLTNYYPIHINTNLTGNGTYQQLLTISDPSHYGINANGSNLAFYDGSNNTHLYAWIQSMNNTSMQVWVKNYNASNTIDMQVLPSFENLFSVTGYLGYGREYFNANHVFTFATDFTNLNGFTVLYSSPQFVNNGVNLTDTNIISNNTYNISSYRFIWNWTTSVISTSSYNYVGFVNGSSFNPPYYSLYGINYYLAQNKTGDELHQFTTQVNGTNTYEIYGNSKEAYYIFNNQNPYTFGNIYYDPMPLNFGVVFANSKGTAVFHYFIVERNITMPTFTIGTFTNMTDHADASYLSNSITIPMPNWFNLTLKAYTNYSFTFHYNNTPLYFVYDGFINNTFYTGFLDGNITLNINFIAFGYSGKTELIVVR